MRKDIVNRLLELQKRIVAATTMEELDKLNNELKAIEKVLKN